MGILTAMFDEVSAGLARAVAGRGEFDVRLLSDAARVQTRIGVSRLAPALFFRARAAGIDVPATRKWQEALRASAARRMVLTHALSEIGRRLDSASVPWLPLKGMGLPAGTYERLEERPTTDLDILVRRHDLITAVKVLREGGWRDVHPHPLSWRFLVEEGYNWQAVGPLPVLLELHFRLWGSVPEQFASDMMDRALPAPERGRYALQVDPVDAAIIAAVHVWQTPVPRPLLFLWDVERMTTVVLDDAQRGELVRRTAEAGLQLYLALSMGCVEALWPSEVGARIFAEALGSCGRFERRVVARGLRDDWDRLTLGSIVLARLLDRRPSRTGWMAPVRSLWPHPGTLVSLYPSTSTRFGRRWRFLVDLAGDPSRLNRRGALRSHRAPNGD